MKCAVCKVGETKEGTATIVLNRNGATVVVKSVPARLCANCGEEYVDEAVAMRLLREAEAAAGRGIQVEVREYAGSR